MASKIGFRSLLRTAKTLCSRRTLPRLLLLVVLAALAVLVVSFVSLVAAVLISLVVLVVLVVLAVMVLLLLVAVVLFPVQILPGLLVFDTSAKASDKAMAPSLSVCEQRSVASKLLNSLCGNATRTLACTRIAVKIS